MKMAQLSKGAKAEESLRMHFLASGAFVVRGVRFLQSDEEVTDIDLWAYYRASELARVITIVDIKNKKSARAFERVMWIKGVQAATGASVSVIATTENRSDVMEFAERMSVQIISGAALQRLMAEAPADERLSQEDFVAAVDAGRNGGKQAAPSARIDRASARLAHGIDFKALNNWIDDASDALRWAVDGGAHTAQALRCTYFLAALVALAADHLSTGAPFETVEQKQVRILRGLTYGSASKADTARLVEFAESAARQFADPTGAASAAIRKGVGAALTSLQFTAMAEYVAKTAARGDLFHVALNLEATAYGRELCAPSDLKAESKVLLGVLADVAEVNRQKLFAIKPLPQKSVGTESEKSEDLFSGKA
jgi:hypothetical protein